MSTTTTEISRIYTTTRGLRDRPGQTIATIQHLDRLNAFLAHIVSEKRELTPIERAYCPSPIIAVSPKVPEHIGGPITIKVTHPQRPLTITEFAELFDSMCDVNAGLDAPVTDTEQDQLPW